MRWFAALLCLPALLSGQAAQAPDPFRPLDPNYRPGAAVAGWRARLGEALARLGQELALDPPPVAALERASLLSRRIRRPQLRGPLRFPGAKDLSEKDRARLHALEAYERVGWASLRLPEGLSATDRKRARARIVQSLKTSLAEAIDLLRDASHHLPTDERSRETLIALLELRGGHADEIGRLRTALAALRLRRAPVLPAGADLRERAARLRSRAEALEQDPAKPDHAQALDLRRRALIFDVCSHTFAFEADPALWEQVALLAQEQIVQENLTRTFRTLKGEISAVPVQYYPSTPEKQVEAVVILAQHAGDTAAAALLALLRSARVETAAAEAVLKSAESQTMRKQLAILLARALFSRDEIIYPRIGRRLLVRLAAEWKLIPAAPVLRAALDLDSDLFVPLGIARALGHIGRPEDADLLVARARNREIDIYFRREAAYAVGRVAPARLIELEQDPDLAIAVAAARYRIEPTQANLGGVLAGLGHRHEVDDAADYCARLEIRAALPALDTFVATRADHYAIESVRRSRDELRARLGKG